MGNNLYTIGYASFSMEDFIDTLKHHNVEVIADVRSAPYSKFKPEFKKEHLNKTLHKNSISYIFLGQLLGARVEDPSCFLDGKLNYSILKESNNFRAGITHIINGIKSNRIALMCAEKDPLNCHRALLISRSLRSYSINILHILSDTSLEEHSITEKRLLELYRLDQPDIFRSRNDRIMEAYDRAISSL